ncbi:MAG: ATP-binding cassette domain-containing protein [Oscillospiraceae bacterium]|nr:ATP-binding cassette domain-containing protein [Oscillospiraceae bacterium]
MEPIIEICDVKKEYRLGAIGGTTLNAELQSFLAKLRGKEDPNKKIGAREGKTGERFMALDGVSFSVQPGEAVGIIGHNGAGKSTLLKLISRVTAPSAGEIRLRGRVASMLEVGTGFHPELTGRENVYLNGAILGMTKKEIDAKFDEIVEFAEMRQFIDTPVKRYSSGMYVKLAFSVAAHLDSEIMIMDEVLAVGDAKFQNKCLGKMSDEAGTGQRAILYVSHNMSTIQRLCTRVIVLDHGRIVYDGDTAGGVAKYLSVNRADVTYSDLRDLERNKLCRLKAQMIEAWLPGRENNLYKQDDTMRFRLRWKTSGKLLNVVLRVYLRHMTAAPAGFATVPFGDLEAGQELESEISLNLRGIVPGSYYLGCEFHEIDSAGIAIWHDYVENMLQIEILENQVVKPGLPDHTSKIPWNHNSWGCLRLEAGMEDRT